MLFSWKFPADVSKWNNETQNRIYTLSHMEVGRVSWVRKKHYLLCLTFSPMHLPWATAGDRCTGCVNPGLTCSARSYVPVTPYK